MTLTLWHFDASSLGPSPNSISFRFVININAHKTLLMLYTNSFCPFRNICKIYYDWVNMPTSEMRKRIGTAKIERFDWMRKTKWNLLLLSEIAIWYGLLPQFSYLDLIPMDIVRVCMYVCMYVRCFSVCANPSDDL